MIALFIIYHFRYLFGSSDKGLFPLARGVDLEREESKILIPLHLVSHGLDHGTGCFPRCWECI